MKATEVKAAANVTQPLGLRSRTVGRPETGEFAARMAELCDGPPTFYNLDVEESVGRG